MALKKRGKKISFCFSEDGVSYEQKNLVCINDMRLLEHLKEQMLVVLTDSDYKKVEEQRGAVSAHGL